MFGVIYGQGSTLTPYSTDGWDNPIEYSTYYHLPIYRLLSNPGGWININTRKIDSLFHATIVFTDSTQLQIRNDTLIHSTFMSGQNSFVGTAQTDTVFISEIDSFDVFTVTPRENIPNANDVISVKVLNGKAVLQRLANGTADLKYNWIWIRKYQ